MELPKKSPLEVAHSWKGKELEAKICNAEKMLAVVRSKLAANPRSQKLKEWKLWLVQYHKELSDRKMIDDYTKDLKLKGDWLTPTERIFGVKLRSKDVPF